MNHTEQPKIRCAIYTRKSTSEGLDMDFNTLDAQREACEYYIKSQIAKGWMALPEMYDDGGYSGGDLQRPAVKRLFEDIDDGKVDCIVVYKVDRLSRSLMDFADIMKRLEEKNVIFVSTTQEVNTDTSMGRLTLNMLFSFAQFEREMISERTRDKMQAARKKGKFVGGMPFLGYDLIEKKLVINPQEARMVREIFKLYMEGYGLTELVAKLHSKGWRMKLWESKNGRMMGGGAFTKMSIYRILTNWSYLGKVTHKDPYNPKAELEIYEGEHNAIIDQKTFDEIQLVLKTNHNNGFVARIGKTSILGGLLKCGICGSGMFHTPQKKKNRVYRYYVCGKKMKQGAKTCSSPWVPAGKMEKFAYDHAKEIIDTPSYYDETLHQITENYEGSVESIKGDIDSIKRLIIQLETRRKGYYRLLAEDNGDKNILQDELSKVEDEIENSNKRITELSNEIVRLKGKAISADDIKDAFNNLDNVWGKLVVKERTRLMHLIYESIIFHPENESVDFNLKIKEKHALQEVAV